VGNLNVALLLASVTVIRFATGLTRDYLSQEYAAPTGFLTAVASWNVRTPAGSWIETQLRARIGNRWTRFYRMGEWSRDPGEHHRHSVAAQADADGTVGTDTLELKKPANAWQSRVFVHASEAGELPIVSLLAVTTGPNNMGSRVSVGSRVYSRPSNQYAAWGIDLDVPERTQRVHESPDALAGGGDAWCSPTSVSMIMAYWARKENQPHWDVDQSTAAEGTYDPVYAGCGNWPFNVAFASEHGLAGWVERLGSLSDMERYIAAGIPLVASIRVKAGELSGSPYPKTDGHLLVVRGFTSAGDVITNDPYALPGHIRIVYNRAQFEQVWMNGSGGIVYVIAPPKLLPDHKM
jgi:Peptidase_C39 like family